MSKTKIEQYPNSLMTVSKILSDRMFKDLPSIEKARKINKIERDEFYKNKEQAKDNVDEFLNKLIKVDGYITELTQYLDITGTDLEKIVDERALTDEQIRMLQEQREEQRRQERLDEQEEKEDELNSYESTVTGSGIKGRRRKLKGGARSDSSYNSGSLSSRSSGSSSRRSIASPMSSNDSSLSSSSQNRLRREAIRRQAENRAEDRNDDVSESSSAQDRMRRVLLRNRIDNMAERIRRLDEEDDYIDEPLIRPQYGRYDAFGDVMPEQWESVSEITDEGTNFKDLRNDDKQDTFVLIVLTKILDEITNINLFYKSKIFKKSKDISIFDLELVNNELIKLYTEWRELLVIFESYPNIKVNKITTKINTQFSKLYLQTKQLNPSLSVADAKKEQFEISIADKMARDKKAYNDYRDMRIARNEQELEDQQAWELRSNDMSNYHL
jgi:hypothetical protein